MPRSARGHDGCENKGLSSTQADLAESKAKHEEREEEAAREHSRRSRAKRDDTTKEQVGLEGIFPTSQFIHDQAATQPGTMSIIPTPGIPTLPRSTAVVPTRHPIFHGRPTPPSSTQTTRRGGFFASGRPHPGDWGRPNHNNFFRPQHQNGGSPSTLQPYAVALIAFGALLIVLGTIATIVCCRASVKRRNQTGNSIATSKSAKSSFGEDDDDTESMAPVSVRDLPITKVPELEGTPRTESRYGPLAPIVPELHGQPRPSELR